MNQKIRIAIDGPSGSGKSTLAKKIAREMGLVYVDTGALYRAVGLYVKRVGVDPSAGLQVTALLPRIQLQLRYTDGGQRVILTGEDVSELIRTPEVTVYASTVSANPSVRKFLLEIQKKMAGEGNVIMDGRDIGTVGRSGIILTGLQLVPLLAVIPATERALKREFDDFGRKR